MNRAHAYKAAIAKNMESRAGASSAAGVEDSDDLDAGINMGLYGYPVLMAADILLFKTNVVPVGKDQVQHIEIARDIAQRFNAIYGPTLVLPEARISAETAVIPGLDGRKMSKSYDNTIALFLPPEKLRRTIFKYKTDSSPPERAEGSEHLAALPPLPGVRHARRGGGAPRPLPERHRLGRGEEAVFDVLNRALEEPRAPRADLMANPARVDALLLEGAQRAQALASPTLHEVRRAVGAR